MGKRPRFKLPKFFRKAGISKLSDLSTVKESEEEQPTSGKSAGSVPRNAGGNFGLSTNGNSQPDGNDSGAGQNGAYFTYSRGEDGETFKWGQVITEDFIKQSEEMLEYAKNGGMTDVVRAAKRSLHYYGAYDEEDIDGLSSLGSDTDGSENDQDETMGNTTLGSNSAGQDHGGFRGDVSLTDNDGDAELAIPRTAVRKWVSKL